MPAASRALRTATARSAALARWGKKSPDAGTDLATERLAAYIERVVSSAPPLTDEQKRRLSDLLGGGEG